MKQNLYGFTVTGYVYDHTKETNIEIDTYFQQETDKKQWLKKIESAALSEIYDAKIDMI